jgi:hypothetical protein
MSWMAWLRQRARASESDGPRTMSARLGRVLRKFAAWFAVALLLYPYYLGRAFADNVGLPHFDGARNLDVALGFGTLPSAHLQGWFFGGGWGRFEDLNLFVHLAWFYLPLALSVYVLFVHWKYFFRFAFARLAVLYLGLALFVVLPTEPPWMTDPDAVTRLWAVKTPGLTVLDANYVAAFPSVHVAGPASIAFWLLARRERDLRLIGAVFALYTLATSFSVVYLGEHFATDAIAGIALAAAVVLAEEWFARRATAQSPTAPERRPQPAPSPGLSPELP